MKPFLCPLSLFLVMTSLISPLTGQSVSKLVGSINSETIAVTINRPPTIASQPTSQTVLPGSTATLTVSATGSADGGQIFHPLAHGATRNKQYPCISMISLTP